ncbi:MAG: ATP-binding protein [Verrucomicrobia bacterium]|nr:ATP-binding protein [Verrucomicrobiota bacterium]
MYKRTLEIELKSLAKSYPVVTVMGPRQSGRTTLVRHVFPEKPYVNLEALDVQEMAQLDPRGFLERYPEGAILDEIQRVPGLLSYIQLIVDENPSKELFILTGSHQLELHQAITQSLAGRTALLQLFPMSLDELKDAGFQPSLDELLLNGGYPRIYKDALDPTKAYRNYFQTYVERDLRQLIHIKDLSQFQRFIRICAGRIGQLINLEGIGNDVGISSHTVKEWISILEASFILIRLTPYFENFGKRMIKSPKLYFADVGLASYLLGIENLAQMERDPLRGHLVENLLVLELYKARLNQGLDPQLYFFRDTHGHEVDLLFQSGHQLIPIEVKASKTFHSDFLKNLSYFQQLIGEKRCPIGYLVYAGTEEQKIGAFELIHYSQAAQRIGSVL